MFHRHEWVEKARTYYPPQSLAVRCSEYLAERIMAGVTTIMWECSKCHKIRREEMLGSVKNGEN